MLLFGRIKVDLKLMIYLIIWYGFTLVSAIYTKLFLNETNDSFTFTIVTFFYGAILKLFNFNFDDIIKHSSNYFSIAVFNIGSLLLTNIAINQTTVSFIYMIK